MLYFSETSSYCTYGKKKYFEDYQVNTKVVIIFVSNLNSYKETIGAVYFSPFK